MKNQQGYSLREAEKIIGHKKSYISKLIKQGKIKLLANKKIDPKSIEKYLKDFKGNQEQESNLSNKEIVKSLESKGIKENSDLETIALNLNMSFYEAQTFKEIYLAKLRQLEYEEKQGNLLDKDLVVSQGQDFLIRIRQKFLSLPVKAAPQIQALDNIAEIQDILLSLVNEILSELSGFKNATTRFTK